uniref:Uncharacterized protein n=1 Tax=Oryzias sinensis TaxID=183150 RepID=A0A8C7WUN5_9TELE
MLLKLQREEYVCLKGNAALSYTTKTSLCHGQYALSVLMYPGVSLSPL